MKKFFNERLRRQRNTWMLEREKKTFTNRGIMRQKSGTQMCEWILTTGNEIKPEINVK